jgi:hypothetical protein
MDKNMDKATQTMIENLYKNTGKTLEQWIAIVKKENFPKHGEILKFLKDAHGLTHGFANLIAHKAKGSDADSAENKDDLIEKQFIGKEHFKPLYDKLLYEIKKFATDLEIAPKNAYVSLRRKNNLQYFSQRQRLVLKLELSLKDKNRKEN